MDRTPRLLAALAATLAWVGAGCAAGPALSDLERGQAELRRLLIETRTDLEEVRRDQEQLRATVEYLQHARARSGTAVPAPEKNAPADEGWPADPWASPSSLSGGHAPVDFDSLQPGQPVPARPPAAPENAAAPAQPAEKPGDRIVAGVRGTGAWTSPGEIGIETPSPSVPEKLAGTLYEQGVNAFNEGAYEEAIQAFRDFIHREPQSPYADDAQFWIGEANLRKGQYSNAIKEFNQVVLRYASGDRSAAALLKLAEVFSKIGDHVDARLSLQKLVNRYPGSAEAAEAYRLLQEMGG